MQNTTLFDFAVQRVSDKVFFHCLAKGNKVFPCSPGNITVRLNSGEWDKEQGQIVASAPV